MTIRENANIIHLQMEILESETDRLTGKKCSKLAYGSNFNLKNESESAVEALAIQFI